MDKLHTEFIGFKEITDEIAREQYGVTGKDKLFISRVRINGEKWIAITKLSEELMADSLFDWKSYLEVTATEQAITGYKSKIGTS